MQQRTKSKREESQKEGRKILGFGDGRDWLSLSLWLCICTESESNRGATAARNRAECERRRSSVGRHARRRRLRPPYAPTPLRPKTIGGWSSVDGCTALLADAAQPSPSPSEAMYRRRRQLSGLETMTLRQSQFVEMSSVCTLILTRAQIALTRI